MIDPIIEKLTKYEGDGENPDWKNIDDVRVGLALLKGQVYPDVPEYVKKYLWHNVRHDVIKEYFEDNLDNNLRSDEMGLENWKITWRE